jgi:glycosyltransferase involved in cell wall biosynthesis
MQSRTSLDILICTYNNARLLERTLEALLKQRVSPSVDWGILVVDNNCTDETAAVVERLRPVFGVDLRRVSEPRQGLTPARVRGVVDSHRDWVAFVDDDCLLAEDWIDQAAIFASDHHGCGAFSGKVILDWEEDPPAHTTGYGWAYAETDLGERSLRRDWLAGAGMVLRRTTLEQSGWIDRQFLDDRIGKRLISGGDVEIGLRIARIAEVWYNPACRLRHLIPAHRTSRPYLRRMIFGLGASGHNTGALTWTGTYPAWLLHSAGQSGQLLWQGVRRLAADQYRRRPGRDIGIALGFVLGWWWAMWQMLLMSRSSRRRLLGGILATPPSSPIRG